MHPVSILPAAIAALLIMSPAMAQASDVAADEPSRVSSNSTGLSAWGILAYGNGLGVGARYMMPVAPEGLLRNERVKDQLAVEFGVDLLHFSYDFVFNDYGFTEVLPVGGLLWNLWLSDNFAVYPKLDLGYATGFLTSWDDTWGTRPTYGGLFWQTSVGVLFKTRSVALRLELGNGLLKGGIGIGF